MKVNIKNFQSIEDVDLEIKGFTTIVGRSNIGKSSVVRAIEGALTNSEGEKFVRDGTRYTEVHLDCPEMDLRWKKGSGFNDYEINGDKLESVGRGAPPQIADAGFKPIETSLDEVSVQVASQFSPIFLIDPTKTKGSSAAEIISDIGRLSEVQGALKNCEKDRRGLESFIRVRDKDLIKVQKDLTSYDGLDADKLQVEVVKDQYAQIKSSQKRVEVLETFKNLMEESRDSVNRYKGLLDVTISKWDEDSLLNEIHQMDSLSEKYQRVQGVITSFKGLDSVEIPSFEEDSSIKSLQAIVKFQDHVDQSQKDLSSFDGVDSLTLPEKPELDKDLSEYQDLLQLAKSLESVQRSLPTLQQEIEELDTELKESSQRIHDILVEAGECPTCGTEVN